MIYCQKNQNFSSNHILIPLSIDFSGDAILNIIGHGQDIGSIADNALRSAVDFGLSFAQNVSSTIPRFAHVSSKSSPEFKHSQLQKSRNDVPQLSDASLVSAFAAKLLKKGTVFDFLILCLEA